jgi:5-methylcytosine-specific restriction endonuclease McrA
MQMGYPKPSKKDRKDGKEQRIDDLRIYRDQQYLLARTRDDGMCVVCYFLEGKKTRASETHHVYSRGKKAGDWREHYTNLINVCSKKHHPQPIQTPGASKDLGWVEWLREQANLHPINENFRGIYVEKET